MKKGFKINWLIIGIALVVVVAAVFYFLIKSGSVETSNVETPSLPGEETPLQPVTYDIEMSEFAFHPNELTINVGDTVTWTNRDSIKHTVTSEGAVRELNSGYLGNNPWDNSYTHTFYEAGTYDYYCIAYPNMKGKIIVQ